MKEKLSHFQMKDEFIINMPALQELLKAALQAEMKRH